MDDRGLGARHDENPTALGAVRRNIRLRFERDGRGYVLRRGGVRAQSAGATAMPTNRP